jgi:hypothetical protein
VPSEQECAWRTTSRFRWFLEQPPVAEEAHFFTAGGTLLPFKHRQTEIGKEDYQLRLFIEISVCSCAVWGTEDVSVRTYSFVSVKLLTSSRWHCLLQYWWDEITGTVSTGCRPRGALVQICRHAVLVLRSYDCPLVPSVYNWGSALSVHMKAKFWSPQNGNGHGISHRNVRQINAYELPWHACRRVCVCVCSPRPQSHPQERGLRSSQRRVCWSYSGGLWRRADLLVDTNVSQTHTVSIFRAENCGYKRFVSIFRVNWGVETFVWRVDSKTQACTLSQPWIRKPTITLAGSWRSRRQNGTCRIQTYKLTYQNIRKYESLIISKLFLVEMNHRPSKQQPSRLSQPVCLFVCLFVWVSKLITLLHTLLALIFFCTKSFSPAASISLRPVARAPCRFYIQGVPFKTQPWFNHVLKLWWH